MKAATITWASGTEFCRGPGFQIYLRSLAETDFVGDRLIFTTEMDALIRQKAQSLGFVIVDVDPAQISNCMKDRYRIWSYYLERCSYDRVITTDAKDVYFQRSPQEILEIDSPVILCSEGMNHSQSSWNFTDQQRLQERMTYLRSGFNDWQVLNGGTYAGNPKSLAKVMGSVWLAGLSAESSDQSALNFVYRHVSTEARILDPNHDHYIATGESIAKNLMSRPPKWEQGQLFASDGQPFAVFHQWDRTQYGIEIAAKYQ